LRRGKTLSSTKVRPFQRFVACNPFIRNISSNKLLLIRLSQKKAPILICIQYFHLLDLVLNLFEADILLEKLQFNQYPSSRHKNGITKGEIVHLSLKILYYLPLSDLSKILKSQLTLLNSCWNPFSFYPP